ncbi:MAG: protein-glutamate O-methyltransferase CheR [Magnetococcales bacterium]|nr:protein-glutamate O-methyltransferase CheR [Magnetococcales bacterium]
MSISAEEFKCIRSFVHEHSGILVGDGKEYLVENRLTVLMVQNGCKDFIELHEKLKTDPGPLRAKVIDAMTTNETLWFRDASFFTALSDHIAPALLEKAKRQPKVRVWSAACSTGQEPYSVAMLLDHGRRRMGAGAPPLEKFEILATDISPSAIYMAQAARYSQLAISRGMRPAFLDRYFEKKGMAYEVRPEIRKLVTFKSFNLKESFTSHGSFDFILCRNVLIYFSDDLKRQIYSKLHGALQREGMLAIGASESPRGYTDAFDQVIMGGAAIFRPKSGGVGAASAIAGRAR